MVECVWLASSKYCWCDDSSSSGRAIHNGPTLAIPTKGYVRDLGCQLLQSKCAQMWVLILSIKSNEIPIVPLMHWQRKKLWKLVWETIKRPFSQYCGEFVNSSEWKLQWVAQTTKSRKPSGLKHVDCIFAASSWQQDKICNCPNQDGKITYHQLLVSFNEKTVSLILHLCAAFPGPGSTYVKHK